MNLNFDSRGRLWVTHSLEYPWPARGEYEPRHPAFAGVGDHDPRDAVSIIEGIGDDGKPSKVTRFAEGLNIPIGQLPLADGALVFSIPNIEKFTDTNGDGKADKRELFMGKFGNVDTHGMTNGFTRWIDGWVYACHGFANTSVVKAQDGSQITLQSGNTYRFRPDGSHVEQFTWGQVNPFGLAIDPYGNVYTADCHSMPITNLIREAYYSSFGKPHDGLGFGPDMINHSHGSTGICGVAYYAAEHFPSDFRDNVFICNPVTGRVHRDKLITHGSTRLIDTQPDFITCDDGWFRPVDVHLGPDGCLYIADFYNCMIGHYEVPLDHPRRDRFRGRIWRVVYRGAESKTNPKMPDLSRLGLSELVAKCSDPNLVVRTLATNQILDKFDASSAGTVRQSVLNASASPEQQAHLAWILEHWKKLDDESLTTLTKSTSPIVLTHLGKILSERQSWSSAAQETMSVLLNTSDGNVLRTAVESIAQHPHLNHVRPLITIIQKTEPKDTHLIHAARIALRNQFRSEAVLAGWDFTAQNEPARFLTTGVLIAIPQPVAAAKLLELSELQLASPIDASSLTIHLARFLPENQIARLVEFSRKQAGSDPQRALEHMGYLKSGLQQRGLKASNELRQWGLEVARSLLVVELPAVIEWQGISSGPGATFDTKWSTELRRLEGHEHPRSLFSTLPRGEIFTGTWRSEMFPCPERLEFSLAGHDGPPPAAPHRKNFVQLVDANISKVLLQEYPPRNDVAQRVKWDLSSHKGKSVFIEVIDGDEGTAFAWLAVGEFSERALNPPAENVLSTAVHLTKELNLEELDVDFEKILKNSSIASVFRFQAASVLYSKPGKQRWLALIEPGTDSSLSSQTREQILTALADGRDEVISPVFSETLRQLSAGAQLRMAEGLASSNEGVKILVSLIEQGLASPRLLMQPSIRGRFGSLPREVQAQALKLTADIPSVSAELDKLLAQRREEFTQSPGNVQQGLVHFEKKCGICHQLAGKGQKIGPQLDGIGIRGLDRILEDILDPNRNVDATFRSNTMALKSGEVKTGLVRREEGQTIVLADSQGKEFTVNRDEIEEQKTTSLSLMPANLAETLTKEELRDVLAYLLSQRTPSGSAAGK